MPSLVSCDQIWSQMSVSPSVRNIPQWTHCAYWKSPVNNLHTSAAFSVNSADLYVYVACCRLRRAFTEGREILQIGWVSRESDTAMCTMWMVKGICLVLAVTLCTALGGVNGEETTKPGLQSAFSSKGLAYSELVGLALSCQTVPTLKLQCWQQLQHHAVCTCTSCTVLISLSPHPLFFVRLSSAKSKLLKLGNQFWSRNSAV